MNQICCVFSQIKDKTYRMGFSFGRLYHAPVVGHGVAREWVKKLNMVMWHIKFNGILSRTGYNWGEYHMISTKAWGFVMAHHRQHSSSL